MLSFLRALFGGGLGVKPAQAADPVEYKGYVIRAAPFANNGHYQTAGTIEREVDGVRRSTASSAPTPMPPTTTR